MGAAYLLMAGPLVWDVKTKLGVSGTVLFLVLLFLQSTAFQSTSLGTELLSVTRLEELAGRTQLQVIREDIAAISVVRVPNTPSHLRVQQYITREIKQHTQWKLETHRFADNTPLGPNEFTNIIATWSPLAKTSPRFSQPENERRVILAAHYDSKTFDFEFVAATDSGVACSLLLDLIRTLEEETKRFSTHRSAKVNSQLSLQVIFFDGEEAYKDWTDTDSLYGSRALAQKWKEADHAFSTSQKEGQTLSGEDKAKRRSSGINNIEVFILLDLIGAKDPIPQFYSYFSNTNVVFQQLSLLEKRLVQEQLYDTSNIPQARRSNPYQIGRAHV